MLGEDTWAFGFLGGSWVAMNEVISKVTDTLNPKPYVRRPSMWGFRTQSWEFKSQFLVASLMALRICGAFGARFRVEFGV